MPKLSVNINKIATIRNARGGDSPNVVEAAINCQHFGADGITIHPRPDERHITNKDVFDIKPIITSTRVDFPEPVFPVMPMMPPFLRLMLMFFNCTILLFE